MKIYRFLWLLLLAVSSFAQTHTEMTLEDVQTVTAAKNFKIQNNTYYSSGYVTGSTTCGLQEAINAAPANGADVVYDTVGSCTGTAGVTINKPLTLEGLCTDGPLDSAYATAQPCSEYANGSTGSTAITIQLPAGNVLGGVTIRNLAVKGNRLVGGATAGDGIRILSGGSTTVMRDINLDNVVIHEAFGAGFHVSCNAFIIKTSHLTTVRNLGDGGLIDSTCGSGGPSQIIFTNYTSDLNTGCGLRMTGTAGSSGDIEVVDSTLDDSASGECLDASSTGQFLNRNVHFEGNTTNGILWSSGSGSVCDGCIFISNGVRDVDVGCAGQGFTTVAGYLDNYYFQGGAATNIRIAASCNNFYIGYGQPINPVLSDSGFETQYHTKVLYKFFRGELQVIGTDAAGGGSACVDVIDTVAADTTPKWQICSVNNAGSSELRLVPNSGSANFRVQQNGNIDPFLAVAPSLGISTGPYGSLYLGSTNSANNFKFQPASTTGARIITIADPLSPTAVGMPLTIGSGTAAMTTAGIATGACGTTVTVAATGVLTTDVINMSHNAAVTIGNGGGLTLNAWPTAGNVNFNYCNSSAGTITPTAMTINWQVTR